MRGFILFVDGAVHAAVWTMAPLLIPSLIFVSTNSVNNDEPTNSTATTQNSIVNDATNPNDIGQRPFSALDALILTGSQDASSDLTISEEQQAEMWQTLPGGMIWLFVVYMLGRLSGSLVVQNRVINVRWIHFVRRVPLPAIVKNVASWKITCHILSGLVSLILLNWGLGIYTFGGWLTIRFLTAFVAEALISRLNKFERAKGHESEESSMRDIEDGSPLLGSEGTPSKSCKNPSTFMSSQEMDKPWLDVSWMAGIATCALLSGILFYPISRFTLAFLPRERLYVFLVFAFVTLLVDKYFFRYASSMQKAYSDSPPSPLASFTDAGIIGSDDSMLMSSVRSSSHSHTSSKMQRRKRLESSLSSPTPAWGSSPSHRPRMDSISSVESDQFFDCLDDIEFGFDKKEDSANDVTNSNRDEQVAIYSRRKIVYPDGAPALVPAGESISKIPAGYLEFYSNNRSKALSRYQLTQQWRKDEKIYSIHCRPHTWFPKLKEAYEHFIHGFTPDGMPVIYEAPGRMKLKNLFRSGCSVKDMINHYCYLMEYLSNLEGVLMDLHSRANDNDDDAWQDELAAFAHAKQNRLENDSVQFGFVVVMDISGVSPTILSGDVLTYLQQAGETNSLHYPWSMRRVVAVNAHFLLGAAWGAIKGVMPASVTADLLSSKQTRDGALKQYIDEDQIPVEYGGKSKYPLGKHPFELGLKKLVLRQETDVADFGDESVDDFASSESYSTPLRGSQSRQSSLLEESEGSSDFSTGSYNVRLDNDYDSISDSTAIRGRNTTREWDDLDTDYVLIMATILHFLLYTVIGSIELALPLCIVSPTSFGGMGYEARRNGFLAFATCAIIALVMKRTNFSRLSWSIAEVSPLRGFRIGVGALGFFLVCVSLISTDSIFGFLCLVLYFALVYFAGATGAVSVECLHCIALGSFKAGSDTLPILFSWMKGNNSTEKSKSIGRLIGYISASSIFRWSMRQHRPFPLGASFHLTLSAMMCWVLYVVSFSLRTVSMPSSPYTGSHSTRRRKKSQFVQAITGWFIFVKEAFMVAFSDVVFLADTFSQRGKTV